MKRNPTPDLVSNLASVPEVPLSGPWELTSPSTGSVLVSGTFWDCLAELERVAGWRIVQPGEAPLSPRAALLLELADWEHDSKTGLPQG